MCVTQARKGRVGPLPTEKRLPARGKGVYGRRDGLPVGSAAFLPVAEARGISPRFGDATDANVTHSHSVSL